ncbi:unnamed protein product [Trifolium pratense]|uniref:Uncharacterized protein n=1 Tax=Trifolium pratense TaxID=57577 RepID=A0ACB0KUV4_TRIPR|nr:unnamed protein product [Trifolium pratense]
MVKEEKDFNKTGPITRRKHGPFALTQNQEERELGWHLKKGRETSRTRRLARD